MLYDQWRAVATGRRGELALAELATGRRWSFGQLLAAADQPEAPAGPCVFPQGHHAGFLLTVLQGWRHHRVVCPLEPGQTPPHPPATPAGIVHLKTTSATTGPPRLIAFTAAQLAADPENLVLTMGLRPDWPNLGVISLAHSYGFSSLVLPLLLHGIPLFLGPSPLPEALRAAATASVEFTLPAVPALWRAWHEANAIPAGVRLAISAGAPLPTALEREVFVRRGLKLHNFYGSSECGGIAYDATPAPRVEASLAGTPVANVTVTQAPSGCLEVQGKAVGWGYWPEPDPALTDGCFRTRDCGEIRKGRIYVEGRVGDVINVAGRKVTPEIIEQALLSHPAVRDCLVLGLPAEDSGRGEEIVAAIVTREAVTDADLRGFLERRLPSWQVPRRYQRLPAIPVGPRGKTSRQEVRRQFTPGTTGGSEAEMLNVKMRPQ